MLQFPLKDQFRASNISMKKSRDDPSLALAGAADLDFLFSTQFKAQLIIHSFIPIKDHRLTMETSDLLSPMMMQWQACKNLAKDALLFFRLGDFYEAFYEDAKIISKGLNLTLTARQGVPMCGVPFHASEAYIDKLIAKGHKVAIAEQVEDPKNVKGLIKREITRIVTPGTLVSSQLLSDKRNNFFAAVVQTGALFGLSYLDLTTGEFRALELEDKHLLIDELCRLRPAEFLGSKKFITLHPSFFEDLSHAFPFLLNQKEETEPRVYFDTLASHFNIPNLDHFWLKDQPAAISAAGMLLLHLKTDLGLALEQVVSIQTEPLSQFMAIDRTTQRHLELTESLIDKKNTLLDFLDETCTPMGGRLLAAWLMRPLLSCSEIEKRQNVIAAFLAAYEQTDGLRKILDSIRDLERLMMKIVTRMANPRDLYALGRSLACLPLLKEALLAIASPEIANEARSLFDAGPLAEKILSALNDTPPLRIGEGDIFKDGFHAELDQFRSLSKDSISWMTRYQIALREETGIKTLKVGYTKAFGYYIEVSKTHGEKVPSFFQRRQTLVNGERFITEELKKFEHQVLSAEERSKAIESMLFENLRSDIAKSAPAVSSASRATARIDVLVSLAKIAKERTLIRPSIDASDVLEIKAGRHPIVERAIGQTSFIANDSFLSKDQQLMLITGPNMAGKSTYIRQVALIVILAQMGSFVPAASARIGLIDKVFSRIGASDDLARGQSTFMVEMSETAHILQNATSRSLILLDEIGRGTSTYDGISIAWAVAEFLLTTPNQQSKTLFATHYWELTRLEMEFPHAMNFQTAVQEIPSGIVFLRKIIRGGTDKSYGIHVAKLAGLPIKAILKAEEMLLQLEAQSLRKKSGSHDLKEMNDRENPAHQAVHSAPSSVSKQESRIAKKEKPLSPYASSAKHRDALSEDRQLSFLTPVENPLITEIRSLDVNQLTPFQALQKLVEWQTKIKSTT